VKLSAMYLSFCDFLEATQDATAETSTFYLVQMVVRVISQPKSVNVNIHTPVLI